jgi:hypothetical protein
MKINNCPFNNQGETYKNRGEVFDVLSNVKLEQMDVIVLTLVL